MPLVDKIEYIANRGSHFKLYLKDQVYKNTVTNNNTTKEIVTFTLNSTNYVAQASTNKHYNTWYLKYLFMESDASNWWYDGNNVNILGTVTILFVKKSSI